jgi:hypothetical protein
LLPLLFETVAKEPLPQPKMSEAHRLRSRNPVLTKDDVGRAKTSCYDLPQEGFAFGRAEPADMEGAREVTMHWAAHVPRAKPGVDCQDFRKINKIATKLNISNAKQLAGFRRENDVKLIQAGAAGPLPKVIPSDVIPSFAYGRKSRPSTPIASVVGYQYAAEYEEALDTNYGKYDTMKAQTDGKTRVRLTKAASSRIFDARARNAAKHSNEEPKPEWKLSKFSKVGSRMGDQCKRSNSMPVLPPDPMDRSN